MARKQHCNATLSKREWQDDYWLLLMHQYLRKPVGIKPTYCKSMVDLSLELHIPPQELHERLGDIARLRTPRIERIWKEYSNNPRRLSRAVQLLRNMTGFNSGGDFFSGVEVQETFERDFRPLQADARLTPVMLILILDLYFRLTPVTMETGTPEVQELARLLHIPTATVVDVLGIFQRCDPQLRRRQSTQSALLAPCQDIWRRFGNDDTVRLADYAEELKAYFSQRRER